MRGKKPSANQRACELPMKSAALSEGKQSSTPGKATSPWQLQADFPLTLALSLREREQRIPRGDKSSCFGLAKKRSVRFSLSPSAGEREDRSPPSIASSPFCRLSYGSISKLKNVAFWLERSFIDRCRRRMTWSWSGRM